jgi:anti-sigma factor RsiW
MTPAMTCQELVELVTDFLEGALPPAARDAFLAHLDDCDDCTTYLRQLEETVALTVELRAPGPGPEALARLREAFRAR